MPKAPTSIVVISIISIIFASLGICGGIFAIAGIAMNLTGVTAGSPMDAVNSILIIRIINIIRVPIDLFLTILLLSSAIASLRLRPWGRKGMLFYAYALPPLVFFSALIQIFIVLPRMAAAPAAGMPGGHSIFLLGIIGAAFGLIVTLAWSALIIYFFNRPIVRDAFNGIFPAAPTAFPIEPTPQDPLFP